MLSFRRVLAFSALGASGALAIDPEETADSPVLKLTTENMDSTLTENKFVLVKFYAPWCGHCKAMAGDYIAAAKKLKELESTAVLGEVDATVETELGQKYEVEGYPTLYWFVAGNKREFTGGRTTDAIVDWVNANMGPTMKEVASQAEVDTLIKERKYVEALFLFEGDDALKKTASDAADAGATVAKFAFLPGKTNALTVYRGTEEKVKYEGESWDLEAVQTWVLDNRAPLFGQINEDNFEIYVEHAKKGLFWVCLNPENIEKDLKQYSAPLVEAAKTQSEDSKYPFVWLDVAEFESHAKEELGCTTFPTLVLQRGDLLGDREDTKVEKFVRSFSADPSSLDSAGIAKFFDDIKTGALEAVVEPDELDLMDDDDEETTGDDDELDEGDAAADDEEL